MTLQRRRARRPWSAAIALILASLGPGRRLAADDGTGGPIAWREEYAAALQESQESGRLLWIQFTGPWCPNCVRMEQDTYPNDLVRRDAREAFVAVKLRSDVNESLAESFELTGLPATVIVSPTRRVLAVRQGYLGPDDLDGLFRGAVAANNEEIAAREGDARRKFAASFIGPPTPVGPAIVAAPKPLKKDENAALSGYCPVSLVSDRRLIEGQAEYSVDHDGRLYRFANLMTFNLFRRDPERYVPANDGECPVNKLDRGRAKSGDPRFGVLYHGRLYLCASKEDRQQFFAEPARYASVGVEERGDCPHCLASDGRRVAGDPRCSLSQAGRRYWFPDESHRDAFLSMGPERLRR